MIRAAELIDGTTVMGKTKATTDSHWEVTDLVCASFRSSNSGVEIGVRIYPPLGEFGRTYSIPFTSMVILPYELTKEGAASYETSVGEIKASRAGIIVPKGALQ